MKESNRTLQTTEGLIRQRFPIHFGDRYRIERIVGSSFDHNDREINYITVYLAPGGPPMDHQETNDFDIILKEELMGPRYTRLAGHRLCSTRPRRAMTTGQFQLPSPLDPTALIDSAYQAVNNALPGGPSREAVHRAISTAYYAVFHGHQRQQRGCPARSPHKRNHSPGLDQYLPGNAPQLRSPKPRSALVLPESERTKSGQLLH